VNTNGVCRYVLSISENTDEDIYWNNFNEQLLENVIFQQTKMSPLTWPQRAKTWKNEKIVKIRFPTFGKVQGKEKGKGKKYI